MPKLIVKNVDTRIDGDYDCEVNDLTNRELHTIRVLSGISPAGIVGGLLAGDAGLTVALASVVLERMGKTVDVDALWDAAGGDVVFDFRGEADVVPPEQPPKGGSGDESNGGSGSGSGSSGSGSRKSSGRRATGPKRSGEPG